MAEDTDLTLKLAIEPDKKSTDATKKTFSDVTSLVSDLAIIGRIAGDALGKVWGSISGSVKVGVESVQDGFNALVNGFDSSEFNKLAEALENIGAGRGDAGGVVAQVNDFIRAFQNPEMGAELIEKFEKAMATSGVDQDISGALRNALQGGEGLESTKLFAQAINSVGDLGNDLAAAVQLVALSNTELDSQYTDFMGVLNRQSSLYDRNLTELDKVNDAMAQLSTATLKIKSLFAENLADELNGFARMASILTSDLVTVNEWLKQSFMAEGVDWLFQKPAELMEEQRRDYATDPAFTAMDKGIYELFKSFKEDISGFNIAERGNRIAEFTDIIGLAGQVGIAPSLFFQGQLNQGLKKSEDLFENKSIAENLNVNVSGLSYDDAAEAILEAMKNSLVEAGYSGEM